MNRIMFHTQELRKARLSLPVLCVKPSAWLGHAYYFWYDYLDAVAWGKHSKIGTGQYEIYQADIDCENIMDTVFNEAYYNFWVKQVEKVAEKLNSTLRGRKCTLREINQYIKDRANWNVVGIMYQDIPQSFNYTLVQDFYYRKRIQLAVFDMKIVRNFVHKSTGICA